jgi:hypothetical protein
MAGTLTWAPHLVQRGLLSSGRRIVSLSLLWLAAGYGCSSAATPVASSDPTAAVPPRATAPGFLPAHCEERSGDLYRTLVASKVEALGTRHVLTVSCEGTHSLYLARSQKIDIAKLLGQPVCARYRYVDQPRPPMPCLRPPCPESERVLDLVEVRPAASPHAVCGNP